MERNWWAYRFAKAMLQRGVEWPYALLFERGCRLWRTSKLDQPEAIADSDFQQLDERDALVA